MTGKAEKEGLRRVKEERSDNTQLREFTQDRTGGGKKMGSEICK